MNVKVIGGVLLIGLILLATWAIQRGGTKEYPTEYIGIEFTYPDYYFYEEREVEGGGRAIVLTEDTAENRELREGTTRVARDGPEVIVLAEYPNEDRRPLEEWLQANGAISNYNISAGTLTETEVGGERAVRYSWSGLYEGHTVAAAKDERIYLFSVSFINFEDRIRQSFDDILASLSLR